MSGIIFAMHAVSLTFRFFFLFFPVSVRCSFLHSAWGGDDMWRVAILTGWERVAAMGGCNACSSPSFLPPRIWLIGMP